MQYGTDSLIQNPVSTVAVRKKFALDPKEDAVDRQSDDGNDQDDQVNMFPRPLPLRDVDEMPQPPGFAGKFDQFRQHDVSKRQPEQQQHAAYLLHYSGFEDPWGVLTDAQLKVKFDETYPELAAVIRIAQRGQQWVFT